MIRVPEDKKVAIVVPRDKQARQVFIEYLEKHGFKCDEDEITSRQSTIDSKFPITVDAVNKMYGHLHNVTCSAAAVTSGRIITSAEFIETYEK